MLSRKIIVRGDKYKLQYKIFLRKNAKKVLLLNIPLIILFICTAYILPTSPIKYIIQSLIFVSSIIGSICLSLEEPVLVRPVNTVEYYMFTTNPEEKELLNKIYETYKYTGVTYTDIVSAVAEFVDHYKKPKISKLLEWLDKNCGRFTTSKGS